jgi:hypothetical protein
LVDNFLSTFVLTYFGMPFHLMTLNRFWTYAEVTYFIPYILLYIAYYLVAKMRILSDKPKKEKAIETEREKVN